MSDDFRKQAEDAVQQITVGSHQPGRAGADAIFDGFMALSRVVQEVGKQKAERRRQKRNASARLTYAIRKQQGIPVRKAKAEPEPELEYVPPTACFCQHTIPPCSYCTDHCCECGEYTEECSCGGAA